MHHQAAVTPKKLNGACQQSLEPSSAEPYPPVVVKFLVTREMQTLVHQPQLLLSLIALFETVELGWKMRRPVVVRQLREGRMVWSAATR